MAETRFVRKRLLVDPKVQGTLILRAVLYWVVCLVTLTLMLLCWRIVTGPARPFYTHFDDMWFHFQKVISSRASLPSRTASIGMCWSNEANLPPW